MEAKSGQFLRKRKGIIGLSFFVITISSGLFFGHLASSQNNLFNLKDGLSTCVSRVKQSYTAKMMASSGSQNLSSSFLGKTEDCFSDTISYGDELGRFWTKEVQKKMNSLASDVHWFNEKLLTQPEGISQKLYDNNVGNRFARIEERFEEILEITDGDLEFIADQMTLGKYIFFAGAFILFFWQLMSMTFAKARSFVCDRSEKDAELELARVQDGQVDIEKAHNIIGEALEQNKLHACMKLLSASLKQKNSVKADLEHETIKKTEQLAKQVKDLSSIGEKSVVSGTLLTTTLSRVVDRLSNRIFTQGVILDLDVSETLRISAKEEDIEILLFQVIQNAIDACANADRKYVSVKTVQSDDGITLSVNDSGAGFSEQQIFDWNADRWEEDGIGLKVCKEILRESSHSIELSNGENGGLVSFHFSDKKASKVDQSKKVVQVKKGTKKELLKHFESQNV